MPFHPYIICMTIRSKWIFLLIFYSLFLHQHFSNGSEYINQYHDKDFVFNICSQRGYFIHLTYFCASCPRISYASLDKPEPNLINHDFEWTHGVKRWWILAIKVGRALNRQRQVLGVVLKQGQGKGRFLNALRKFSQEQFITRWSIPLWGIGLNTHWQLWKIVSVVYFCSCWGWYNVNGWMTFLKP